MRREIVAAGFGGQGIVLMGVIMAVAAGIYDKKWVAQTQSYGPASRGGASRTDVIISDEEIDYAEALSPDIMIIMSPQAAERYLNEARQDETLVIVDSTLVTSVPDKIVNVYRIPATEIAEQKMGHRMVANMVMLGALAALSNAISYESLISAIKDSVRKDTEEINLAALQEGYRVGQELKTTATTQKQ